MMTKEEKYRDALIRFARGEISREQVRSVDPHRETIKQASKMAAQAYSDKLRTTG